MSDSKFEFKAVPSIMGNGVWFIHVNKMTVDSPMHEAYISLRFNKEGFVEGLYMAFDTGEKCTYPLVLARATSPTSSFNREGDLYVHGDKKKAKELAVQVLCYFLWCLPHGRTSNRILGHKILSISSMPASTLRKATSLLDKDVFSE